VCWAFIACRHHSLLGPLPKVRHGKQRHQSGCLPEAVPQRKRGKVLRYAGGAIDCAKILLDAKADINATDPDGNTGVVLAIISGHYDVAGYLIDKGADPNLADVTGRTALYAAAGFSTMPNDNRPAPKVVDRAAQRARPGAETATGPTSMRN
jgi:hypothetical protein